MDTPTIVSLPESTSDIDSIEVTPSNELTPDLALIVKSDALPRYVQFIELGEDGGRIDVISPSSRPMLHAARPDLDGDGIRERCVADAFWVPDDVETGIVACFPPGTGGTLGLDAADSQMFGEIQHSRFGYALDSADLDGDGRDELVVGAPTFSISNRAGLIYILKEVDGALTIHATLSDFAIDSGFGRFLGVGDLDGDGLPDIVTTSVSACFDGTSTADPAASCPGAAWVIPGAAGLW